MNTLNQILDSYRKDALSESEKGTAFEKLIAAWLCADPVQSQHFSSVDLWSNWQSKQGQNRTDVGIDLVATRHDGGLTAIQCKFFGPDARIRKENIDSFISASGKEPFSERVIVETTEGEWSPNAREMLRGQSIPVTRIGLRDLQKSRVDWSRFAATGEILRPEPKKLRDDQREALEAVRAEFAEADRGKLIMACGTGKTLTSLRITEDMVGMEGHVLYLVPSLALMSQTVHEWCSDALVPLTAFAVCSDTHVGKRRRSMDDVAELDITDLDFPATTDPKKLARAVRESDPRSMRVVFATYHSISVIEEAQLSHDLPEFDLIICDEAHRTTGATFAGEDESNFLKVHRNEVIHGKKRLYMTATPRIYGENAKTKAREADAVLASMDDEALYGRVMFEHTFARAVESDILSDYRVVVLVMDEGVISHAVQNQLADSSHELRLDDATRMVGCWKALSKQGLEGDMKDDDTPMRRALAFCNSIASSELVRDVFEKVVTEYQQETGDVDPEGLVCEVRHVDGTYHARERGERLDWLKEDGGSNVCRILSNARCLSEGVDVPALDAIMFLHPRKSQIDVVQAVGRVMRKAPGKKGGYVILPIGVPPGVPADQALNDNERYRVIWQVLNALRAHDERLDAVINQGGLGQDVSGRIAIVDGRTSRQNQTDPGVTAVIDTLPARRGSVEPEIGGGGAGADPTEGKDRPVQTTIPIVINEFSRAVMAKIVDKCGTRVYWGDWAREVADIAERHITRIRSLVEQPGSDAHQFFHDFLREIRKDLNDSISEEDAIEMLAQHLITRPVFEALFEGHEFVEKNPVSRAMTELLSVIDEKQIEREAKNLEGFYASVKGKASGITDPQARQKLIVELYDKFFSQAFPRTTQMLGIVYTPVEVVDFIIRSVNDVLEDEFGQTLGSEGVHILDPFVGTGTFITRLLQSGLITPEQMERKYREEIHASEIVLLAYYIAAINIETVFHSLTEREEYLSFPGICLTDTFSVHKGENRDDLSYMKNNTDRRERQEQKDIRVIMGNPPYSAGQKSENDNAKNVGYPQLDDKIQLTYAHHSNAALVKNLYDSYIRAIRWGSDRIGDEGVMAFISGSAWIERSFADGMRKCLAEEFSSIHVFHLRGDVRKNMLSGGRAGEGENIFGQGSMTGVAITVFVKNPAAEENGRILFHDIGDYLDREQKLDIVRNYGSIRGISETKGWTRIVPDVHGDWLDQRDAGFEEHLPLGDKKDQIGRVLFSNYSCGVVTSRDAWCINPSKNLLTENIGSMIDFYNSELERWIAAHHSAKTNHEAPPNLSDFLNNDPTRISWSRALKQDVVKGKELKITDGQVVPCLYRPFTKQWQFFSRRLNEMVYQMPRIYPNAELPNRVIAVTGKGAQSGYSVLMMDTLPNYHTIHTGQCFPFWLYEETDMSHMKMEDAHEDDQGYFRREAISDWGLRKFQEAYPGIEITKEDIFHYIYGVLHSEDYRNRYATNLSKELPRIPLVKTVGDFQRFRDAGKKLDELHVNFETVEPWHATVESDDRISDMAYEKAYRVTKMKHPGTGKNKDRSTVIYNPYITIRNIPDQAWDYGVNGKPALSWVMERQCVKTDKASGIMSDANRYAIETEGNPRYSLDILLKVITVSVETMNIVRNLPELDI